VNTWVQLAPAFVVLKTNVAAGDVDTKHVFASNPQIAYTSLVPIGEPVTFVQLTPPLIVLKTTPPLPPIQHTFWLTVLTVFNDVVKPDVWAVHV
jgi:hypothetical protein